MESKNITVNKKVKCDSRDNLMRLSKEELVDRLVQLQAHNNQLKNILQKTLGDNTVECRSGNRKFNFETCHTRHVLLKFLYYGWDYQGYATQEHSISTIEHHLFYALQKTCLIESRQTSNYHRCGRTDKEVSAFCQVVSINLRSKFEASVQNDEENVKNELDYCTILNRVLPKDIKCIAWMPLKHDSYSARFDCVERKYRYFFPGGNLNIEAMREACEHLHGTHDFRNLCKMDVANGVTNFMRTIKSADIFSCQNSKDSEKGYNMFYFQIVGRAFLWHQVRSIMAILVLVGEEKEDPSIIKDLLNIDENPCKPQYDLAAGFPLNLYDCEFRKYTIPKPSTKGDESDNESQPDSLSNEVHTTEWSYSQENLETLISDLQQAWSSLNIKATMIRENIVDLLDIYTKVFGPCTFESQGKILSQGVRSKIYQKLLTRKRCESLENRLDHYIKKQRLIVENENDSIE